MLCDKCKKNSATVYYQQIVNGEKEEFHLCEDCAAKMQGTFSFDSMFKGFLDGFMNTDSLGYSPLSTLVCPECKMTFDEFKDTCRIGCSSCYDTFRRQFTPALKNIHGSTKHSGKIPKKAGAELSLQREIENLRLELKQAVENEEYEKAAELRDKIKGLEGGNAND